MSDDSDHGRTPRLMVFKVTDFNRTVRYGVAAQSFENLLAKCAERFNITRPKLFLDADGTEIDDHLYLSSLPQQTLIMATKDGEEWHPTKTDKPETSVQGRVSDIINTVRRRNTTHSDKQVKLLCGWMVYNLREKRYISVRTGKGGGARTICVARGIGYKDLTEELVKLFFPNAKSPLGKSTKYNHRLGDAASRIIHEENFNLSQSLEEMASVSSNRKCKIYLLSREKMTLTVLTDSESDDDFLPELTGILKENTDQQQTTGHQSQGILQAEVPGLQPTVSKCTICVDRVVDTVVLPCGHTTCNLCAHQIQAYNQPCPICRKPIEELKSIYF